MAKEPVAIKKRPTFNGVKKRSEQTQMRKKVKQYNRKEITYGVRRKEWE